MNYAQLVTRVQNYINDTSTATETIIKESLNERVDSLMQQGFWSFAMRSTTVDTASGTNTYYLPTGCDRIIDIRQVSSPIQLVRIYAGDFDRLVPYPTATGRPLYYVELLEDRVKAQPSTTAKIIALSTSNEDIAAQTGATYATLYGQVNGVDRTESWALSAQNVISSTNSFSKLYSITTDIVADGTIRFTEAVAGTELLELYPGFYQLSYKKFQLHPIPDSTYTLYIKYQAKNEPMINDADVPIIPAKYAPAIYEGVIGDMLNKQGDTKAVSHFALAEQSLATMRKDQDMLYDTVPTIRGQGLGNVTTDASYPFSY